MLIFLFRGYLPWSFDDSDDYAFNECSPNVYSLSKRTLKLKLSLPIEIICKDMPSEFARHLKYARSLKYEDTPDYGKVRDMYRRLMKRMGYQYDGVYDWDLKDRKADEVKPSSGAIIPASVQDEPSEQEKHVPQSDSLIPETPLVQDKPLEQTSRLKRKNPEDDKESDQGNKPEEITQPTKKRKIIFKKAADKKQSLPKRPGRPPKAQPKKAMTTTKTAENKDVADKKAAPRRSRRLLRKGVKN